MIKARMIIEVMGSPEEYIAKSLQKAIEQIKMKGSTVSNEKYAEPKKVGDKYFSTFVEFEVEVKDIEELLGIVVDYGPSTIEVIEPHEFKVDSTSLQAISNDISATLHNHIKTNRILEARNKVLQREILELKVKKDSSPKSSNSDK